jgi:alkaline phosphatase D
MKPNFPYTPLRGNRIKGFDLLVNYLWPETQHESLSVNNESNELESSSSYANSSDFSLFRNESDVVAAPLEASASPVEFMLFLGDFIYADSPWYFGDDKEAYRRLYRRNYQSRSFRKVYERLRKSIFQTCLIF